MFLLKILTYLSLLTCTQNPIDIDQFILDSRSHILLCKKYYELTFLNLTILVLKNPSSLNLELHAMNSKVIKRFQDLLKELNKFKSLKKRPENLIIVKRNYVKIFESKFDKVFCYNFGLDDNKVSGLKEFITLMNICFLKLEKRCIELLKMIDD